MFEVYTLEDLVERFETVEEAVKAMVTYWNEPTEPETYIIRKENTRTVVCTLAPVGRNGCLAVYVDGRLDSYTDIEYVMDPDTGRICMTECCLNGVNQQYPI